MFQARGAASISPEPAEKQKTLIVELRHCEPGQLVRGNNRGHCGVISQAGFPVTITSTMGYDNIITLLAVRVKKVFDFDIRNKDAYSGLNIKIDGQNMLINDDESWLPCRDLLLEGGAEKPVLRYNFFIFRDMPDKQREESRSMEKPDPKKLRCRMQ